MNKVMAMVLAGGRGDRLSILSEERAKPAVPFAGKYRIIDFTLSNCVNSGVATVALLTQYRPRSLNDHIGIGRPWDLDRSTGGIVLLQPYVGRSHSDWYKGTADAVYQNLYFVEESRVDEVLILAGDHIYTMHYDEMVRFHREHKADVTIGVTEVAWPDATRYGILSLGSDGRVQEFVEKPAQPKSNLASMGIYVFNKETLIEKLSEDTRSAASTHDFGRDVVPSMIESHRVMGFRFTGYWRDVGTVESYWQANMDLIQDLPVFNLYDPSTVVRTKPRNRPPAKSGPHALVHRSLICDGCILNGTVRTSVVSPGSFIEDGAVVEDSILFDDTFVGRGARLHRAIVDKEVTIGAGAVVGWGDDMSPNHDEPTHLNTGITIVGKRAQVPAGARIGRNCKVLPGVREQDYPEQTVPSGRTVARRQ